MQGEYDYGVHFREFHQTGLEYAEKQADWNLQTLMPYLPVARGIDVLDIGCGMGFALLAFKKFGYKTVLGVDIDQSQIDACREIGLDAEKISDLATYLKLNPKRFGLISLFDVLEHIRPDKQIETLRDIHEALAPGGRLLVKVPNASSIVAARWQFIDFTHFTSYTEYSIRYAIRTAGFARVDVPATENLEPRPSLRLTTLFTAGTWVQLKRWIVRRTWRMVMSVEFGDDYVSKIPLGLNLMAIADKEPA